MKWLLILTIFQGGDITTIPFANKELCEYARDRWLNDTKRKDWTYGDGSPAVSATCVRQEHD